MENLPAYIGIVFGLTTFITIGLFYKASSYSKSTLLILLLWLAMQTILGLSSFYTITNTFPPRLIYLILPPILLIVFLFLTSNGRRYIDHLNQETLTLLHIIRIPVEMVLLWLCVYKMVPNLMTFEGRNFDILSGITAPFIYYLGFIKKQLNRKFILFWNIICLILLLNIVANAILSAPIPFQQFAFDQPNLAVLYFPFNWLPSLVVPLVLFSHLASIRKLILTNSTH